MYVRERERERKRSGERETEREAKRECVCVEGVCVYVYTPADMQSFALESYCDEK